MLPHTYIELPLGSSQIHFRPWFTHLGPGSMRAGLLCRSEPRLSFTLQSPPAVSRMTGHEAKKIHVSWMVRMALMTSSAWGWQRGCCCSMLREGERKEEGWSRTLIRKEIMIGFLEWCVATLVTSFSRLKVSSKTWLCVLYFLLFLYLLLPGSSVIGFRCVLSNMVLILYTEAVRHPGSADRMKGQKKVAMKELSINIIWGRCFLRHSHTVLFSCASIYYFVANVVYRSCGPSG